MFYTRKYLIIAIILTILLYFYRTELVNYLKSLGIVVSSSGLNIKNKNLVILFALIFLVLFSETYRKSSSRIPIISPDKDEESVELNYNGPKDLRNVYLGLILGRNNVPLPKWDYMNKDMKHGFVSEDEQIKNQIECNEDVMSESTHSSSSSCEQEKQKYKNKYRKDLEEIKDLEKLEKLEKLNDITKKGNYKTKRRVSESMKKRVAAKQNWRCGLCSKMLDETYEIDHKIPLFKGGTNDIKNLMALDPHCHRKKTMKEK